jgi:hypothetical protein
MFKNLITKNILKMPEFLKDSKYQIISQRHNKTISSSIGYNQGHFPPFITDFKTSSPNNSTTSSSSASSTSSSSNSIPESFQPPADSESYVKVRMPNIKGFLLFNYFLTLIF